MRLTLKMVLHRNPQMKETVYSKYPLSKDERRGCATEKAFRDAMRLDYAKKLLEHVGKQEINTTLHIPKQEV